MTDKSKKALNKPVRCTGSSLKKEEKAVAGKDLGALKTVRWLVTGKTTSDGCLSITTINTQLSLLISLDYQSVAINF